MVRLMNQATAIALTMPAKYSTNSTSPCRLTTPPTSRSGMKAAMISAYTGSRAEQVISGAIMIVTSRSRGFWMVRAAMMPGIAQANDWTAAG